MISNLSSKAGWIVSNPLHVAMNKTFDKSNGSDK